MYSSITATDDAAEWQHYAWFYNQSTR